MELKGFLEKDKNIYLYFYGDYYGARTGLIYEQIYSLLDFSNTKVEEIIKVFSEFANYYFKEMFLDIYGDKNNIKSNFVENINNFINIYLDRTYLICPYFCMYSQALIDFILNYEKEISNDSNLINERFKNFAQKNNCLDFFEIYDLEIYDEDYDFYLSSEIVEFIFNGEKIEEHIRSFWINKLKCTQLFLDLIKYAINRKRELIKNEVNFILELKGNDNFNKLSKLQKLFVANNERKLRNMPEYEYSMSMKDLAPIKKFININLKFEELSKNLYDNKNEVKQMFNINTPDELIYFDCMNLIMSNYKIKRCIRCGRYFIASGSGNRKYCDRRQIGEQFTCKDVGIQESFKKKILNNEAYKLYQPIYKKYFMRRKRGKMSDNEYTNWLFKAKNLYERYCKKEIDLENYKIELNLISQHSYKVRRKRKNI